MSNNGVLKLRVKEGESIYIGKIEVVLEDISVTGMSASLVVLADKSIPIIRGSALNKENKAK